MKVSIQKQGRNNERGFGPGGSIKGENRLIEPLLQQNNTLFLLQVNGYHIPSLKLEMAGVSPAERYASSLRLTSVS